MAIRWLAAMLAVMLCVSSLSAEAVYETCHLAPAHQAENATFETVALLMKLFEKKVYSRAGNEQISDGQLLASARECIAEAATPPNILCIVDLDSLCANNKTLFLGIRDARGMQYFQFSSRDNKVVAQSLREASYLVRRLHSEMSAIHAIVMEIEQLRSHRHKKEQEEERLAELEKLLIVFPRHIPPSHVAGYHRIVQSLSSASLQKVQSWFNDNTALPAMRHLKGTAAWKMPEGNVMTVAAHNAQLFKVLQELAAGNAKAFRKRHEDRMGDEEWEAYEKAVYSEGFKRDFDTVAAHPEELEMLAAAAALHDIGKLLRGEHAANSARLAEPVLLKLGYRPGSKKYRWILLLIKTHLQLGGGFFFGESSPILLLDAMRQGGVRGGKEIRQFLRLLSLLTFADMGAVGTGRFTADRVMQLRMAAQLLQTHPDDLVREWPQLRLLGLYGRPVLPIHGDTHGNKGLAEYAVGVLGESAGKTLGEALEPRGRELDEFLQRMEFSYARFLMGPPIGGGEYSVQPANAVKWMVLANGLWQGMDRCFTSVRFESDAQGASFNMALQDADCMQIQAMLHHRKSEIIDALRAGTSVHFWGIPMRLSADSKTLLVDTRHVDILYDRSRPVEIGKARLAISARMSEAIRLPAHVRLVRAMGYVGSSNTLRNIHYDGLGLLSLERQIPGSSRFVTYKFSNSRLFDLDVSAEAEGVDDLFALLGEHRPLEVVAGMSPEAMRDLERRNAIHEDIRYFVFKRLVKFRGKAKHRLHEIKAMLGPHMEPSAKVLKEAAVAVNMIEGRTVKGGKRRNIVFVTYEATPLIKKGGLADVSGALPRVLRNKGGHNVSVIMPYWTAIDRLRYKEPFIQPKYERSVAGPDGEPLEVYSVVFDGTPIYLVKCDKYFHVDGQVLVDGQQVDVKADDIYRQDVDVAYSQAHPHMTHPLNAETAIFFSRASLMVMEAMGQKDKWKPDIISTADWQTGLVPALIKKSAEFASGKYREFFKRAKTVHTIHNLGFKGLVKSSPAAEDDSGRRLWEMTGLPADAFYDNHHMGMEAWGAMSLMKAGLVFADAVTTVSPGYAAEIKRPQFGAGFEGIFRVLKKFLGILNGIARREWNPREAKSLLVRYEDSPTTQDRALGVVDIPEGKRLNKAWVRAHYGLDPRAGQRVPLIVYTGRFDEMKGLHLLLPMAERLLKDRKAQFIFVGKGSREFHEKLNRLVAAYPSGIAQAGFVEEDDLRPIIAAADIGAVLSTSEPCGLVQMQYMRFGTIPLVNSVGGLKDTVADFAEHGERANGYVLPLHEMAPSLDEKYLHGHTTVRERVFGALGDGFERILADYQDEDAWNAKVRQTYRLSGQVSWEGPADQYEALFDELLDAHHDVPRDCVEPADFGSSALAPRSSLLASDVKNRVALLGDVLNQRGLRNLLPLIPASLHVQYPVARIPLHALLASMQAIGLPAGKMQRILETGTMPGISRDTQRALEADKQQIMQSLHLRLILDSLVHGLKDPDSMVRERSAYGLGNMQEVILLLDDATKAMLLTAMLAGLRDEEPKVAEAYRRALKQLSVVASSLSSGDQAAYFRACIAMLKDSRWHEAQRVLDTLVDAAHVLNAHPLKSHLYTQIRECSEGLDWDKRELYGRAMARIMAVKSATESWDWPERSRPENAAMAIDEAKFRSLLDDACAQCDDGDWQKREDAVRALGRLGRRARILRWDDARVMRLLLLAARDEIPYVRKEAMDALAAWAPEHADARLLQSLDSEADALVVLKYFLAKKIDLELYWKLAGSEYRKRLFPWIACGAILDIPMQGMLERMEDEQTFLVWLQTSVGRDARIQAFDTTRRWEDLERKCWMARSFPCVGEELLLPHIIATLRYLRDGIGGSTGFRTPGNILDRLPALEKNIAAIFDAEVMRQDMRMAKRLMRSVGVLSQDRIEQLREASKNLTIAVSGEDTTEGLVGWIRYLIHTEPSPNDLPLVLAYRDYVHSDGNAIRAIGLFRLMGYSPMPSDIVPIQKKAATMAVLETLIHSLQAVYGEEESKDLAAVHRRYQRTQRIPLGDLGSILFGASKGMHALHEITTMRRQLQERLRYQRGEAFAQGIRLDIALEAQLYSVINTMRDAQRELPFNVPDSILLLKLLVENARLGGNAAEDFQRIEDELEALALSPSSATFWLKFNSIIERIERQIDSIAQVTRDRFQPMVEILASRIGVADQERRWVDNFSANLIRSEPLYQLSLQTDAIGEEVRKQAGKSRWHVIVRGKRVGKVRVVKELREIREKPARKDEIIVIAGLPPDAPAITEAAGIITFQGIGRLSHAAFRARDKSVPIPYAVATGHGLRQQWEALDGKWVELTVGDGDVQWHRVPASADEFMDMALRKGEARVQMGPVDLDCESVMLEPAQYRAEWVGAKAMRLREMQREPALGVETPPHFALPFSAFERVLLYSTNGRLARRIQLLIRKVSSEPASRDLAKNLDEIRSLIGKLEIPDAILQPVYSKMKSAFRGAAVFVRSSSNTEDLAAYAGAGLHDSYGGIVRRHELEDTMLRVWASLWNERAFEERQSRGMDHRKAKMALLIQAMAPVDYSFVLDTVDPASGDRRLAVMEVIQGFGEPLVSGDPRFQGTPFRIVYDRVERTLRVEAFADMSQKIIADAQGYLGVAQTDYLFDTFLGDEKDRERLREVFETGLRLEAFFGRPQDIEGTIARADGHWLVHILQSRGEVFEESTDVDRGINDFVGAQNSIEIFV